MVMNVTLVEEAIEEQGLKVRVFFISGGNVAEENGLRTNGVNMSVANSQ